MFARPNSGTEHLEFKDLVVDFLVTKQLRCIVELKEFMVD